MNCFQLKSYNQTLSVTRNVDITFCKVRWEIRLLHAILILWLWSWNLVVECHFFSNSTNRVNQHYCLLGVEYPARCVWCYVHIDSDCPTTSVRKIVFYWPEQQTIATWFPFYPNTLSISGHSQFLFRNTKYQATEQSTLGPVLTAILEFYNVIKRLSVKSPPVERTNRKRHLCLVYVLSSLSIGKIAKWKLTCFSDIKFYQVHIWQIFT